MKKIAILVASALILGGFGTGIKTYADEPNTLSTQTTQATTQTTESAVSYKEEAGITPDSLLYIIDKAVDQLRVVLANNSEKEAEVIADIAKERLGESEVMTEKGKVELALKALEEYNEKISEAAKKLQEVVVNLEAIAEESAEEVVEQNVEDTAEENIDETADEGTEEALEENTDDKLEQSITDLEKIIQELNAKSLVVLDSLKGIASEESVDAVEEIIEEQINHKAAVANFVAERHEFNAAKKSLNMAKVALKKVQKGGNEATIKAAQDKLASAQKEYMLAQAELHEAFQVKKASDLGIEVKDEDVDSEETVQAISEEATATEENNEAVEETITTEEAVDADKDAKTEEASKVESAPKAIEYKKTNNGNGNGNGSKPAKIEKEKNDKKKSAPGKSGEAPGKSGQANGKKK